MKKTSMNHAEYDMHVFMNHVFINNVYHQCVYQQCQIQRVITPVILVWGGYV